MWWMEVLKPDGTPIAEVRNATERQVSLAMGKPSTASFTVRADNPLMPELLADEDRLLRVWGTTGPVSAGKQTLRFVGPIITAEMANQEDGTGPSVRINAADVAWRLSKRISGRSKAGTTFTAQDKGEIAFALISSANTDGATGIYLGGPSIKSESIGTYTAGPYKSTLACINDLANGIDGFDWWIEPLENKALGLGTWVAKPVFGITRTGTAFDYGWGKKNVRQVSYIRDMTNMANVVYHVPDDTEIEATLSASDATSITNHGRFEAIAELGGLTNTTFRTKWIEENLIVRKNPRRVLALTLDSDESSARVPEMGTHTNPESGDFWLGDFVPVHGVIGGKTIFNGKVRVYQINIAIADTGRATITPILLDDNAEL